MKIAYISFANLSAESGVLKKINNQILSWSEDDANQVKLFNLTSTRVNWKGLDGIAIESVIFVNKSDKLSKSYKLIDKVLRWNPDIVYLRYSTYYPCFSRLFDKCVTIMEVNSDDLSEYKISYTWYKYWYHLLTRNIVLNGVTAFVFLSSELLHRINKYDKPNIVLGNGIDFSFYNSSNLQANADPQLVFIGSPGYDWHGLDKIFKMAKHFPSWSFDVIGFNANEFNSIIPDNVRLHGYLTSDCYAKILSNADVAIGTLALHRKDMNEASPLKVREYLAFGLPTIIAYDETDFPGSQSFLLKIPNTENNVIDSLSEIEHFVLEWKGKRVNKELIAHLDIHNKERIRLNFFKKTMRKCDYK